MVVVDCGLLLDVRCCSLSFFVGCCSLFVVCCVLFVVRSLLLWFVVGWWLCLSLVVGCLFVVCCLLFVVCCVLVCIVRSHVVFVVCCLMFVVVGCCCLVC